jgi:hypothetical protein
MVSLHCPAGMTSEQRWGYVDPTVQPAMELMGYCEIQANSPSEDMVRDVKKSLRERLHEVSGSMVYGRGDHDACERFLNFGIPDGDVCLPI